MENVGIVLTRVFGRDPRNKTPNELIQTGEGEVQMVVTTSRGREKVGMIFRRDYLPLHGELGKKINDACVVWYGYSHKNDFLRGIGIKTDERGAFGEVITFGEERNAGRLLGEVGDILDSVKRVDHPQKELTVTIISNCLKELTKAGG